MRISSLVAGSFSVSGYAQEADKNGMIWTIAEPTVQMRSRGIGIPKSVSSENGEASMMAFDDDGSRRSIDLYDMAEYWFRAMGHTEKFDHKDIWAYGCHCMLLTDRPLSDLGHGHPVDEFDKKCQKFKDCQRCARMKHGEECMGELVRYSWGRVGNKNHPDYPMIRGKEDMNDECQMDLFYCDRQFVEDSSEQIRAGNHDPTKNYFRGFDPTDPDNCIATSGGPVNKSCCGGAQDSNGPWNWYNKALYTCENGQLCENGDLSCDYR